MKLRLKIVQVRTKTYLCWRCSQRWMDNTMKLLVSIRGLN